MTTTKEVTNKSNVVTIDPKSPANARLTYALYNANRAASKIDGCKIHNDWHKQGLTHGECLELIAKYNKVTGFVYAPKSVTKIAPKEVTKQVKKPAKSAQKEASPKPANTPKQTDINAGKIQALKEMRKEGLLSVAELVEALNGLQ